MRTKPPPASLLLVTTVQCSCGKLVSGASAEELLAAVEAHIDAEHGRQRERVEERMSAREAQRCKALQEHITEVKQ